MTFLFAACSRQYTNEQPPRVSTNSPLAQIESQIAQAEQQRVGPVKFSHSAPMHSSLPCLLCHRRKTNSAQPSMPGGSAHVPCAGCHAKEFQDSANPICVICHTNVQSGALKPFPTLKSFGMTFDHYGHLKMEGVTCSACHYPTNAGIALSIPAGLDAHVLCYRCHTSHVEAGSRDISSCGICHQLGSYVGTPEFMRGFKVGFSHAKHGTTQNLTCSDCHQLQKDQPLQKQISMPQPLNHHASGRALSCMTCHNGKRAFGGDDFSVCKRCHKSSTWHF